MKKRAIKVIEGIALCFALVYLTQVSFKFFNHLIGLLPIEFIVYMPLSVIGFAQTALWASIIIAIAAIAFEWKREKRWISYLVFVVYLSAPFVASTILFFITEWRIGQSNPMLLEHGGQLPFEEIPIKFISIGYVIFPIAHFIIIRIKGRSSRSDQPMSAAGFSESIRENSTSQTG